MAKVADGIAARVAASGLVEEASLARVRDELGDGADDQRVLEWLIDARLLTKWQAAQLKAGRTQNLVLGHYKLLAPLGAGGMGSVFRARDARLGREVAIKVLPPSAATPEAVGRFRREALAALELRHDHVVASFELAQQGSIHYLVMELVDGPSLAAHLADKKRLSVQETARIGYQVALALEHARQQGIVHRDIKPSNILLSRQGQVKVADLGLAKFFGPRAQVRGPETRTGQFMGTIDYCAPEQAQDAKRADIRSDIYSLGCTLYHCLTGRPPFPDGTEVERIMAHIELLPGRIGLQNPDVSPALAELIEKRMVAKQPAERFQTPAEVAEALAPWAKGEYAAGNPWASLSGLESLLDEAAPAHAQGKAAAQGAGETKPAPRRRAPTLQTHPVLGRRGAKSASVLARPLGWAAIVVAVLAAITAASLVWPRKKLETAATVPSIDGSGATDDQPATPDGPTQDKGQQDRSHSGPPAEETSDVTGSAGSGNAPERDDARGSTSPPPDEVQPNTLTDDELSQGWKLLFDGKSLDGWQMIGPVGVGYNVEDGTLVCPSDGGGKLFTNDEYANFILRFEYRLEPGGNNGVALRAPLEGDAAYTGMESQILDDDAPQNASLEPAQYHGSIYNVLPAKRGAPKAAGQWNSEEIVCDGRHVKVTVNGQVTLDDNLDEVSDPNLLQKHPGLQRQRGYVGFLGHRPARVEFCSIRIKELPDRTRVASEATATKQAGLRLTLKHGQSATQAVAMSADGSTLLTASGDTVRVWNTADGALRGVPLAHTQPVTSASLSADARYAVTKAGEGADLLVNLTVGKIRRFYGQGTEPHYSLWDLSSGEGSKPLLTARGAMAFGADGKEALAFDWDDASGNAWFRRLQLTNGASRDTPLMPREWTGIMAPISLFTFSRDLQRLATIGHRGARRVYLAEPLLWETSSGGIVGKPRPLPEETWVDNLCFHPDGHIVVAAVCHYLEKHLPQGTFERTFSNPRLHLLHVPSARVLKTFKITERMSKVAFDPRGDLLICRGIGGTLELRDADTGQLCGPRTARTAAAAAFSGDGSQLLVGNYDGTAQLWELDALLLPADKQAALGPNDMRIAWVYKDQFGGKNSGSFKRNRAGTWVEDAADGKHLFDEWKRTADYVLLFDRTRRMFLRCYDDHIDLFRARDGVWARLYHGSWAKP